jgi:AraC-like DNA-binding protein
MSQLGRSAGLTGFLELAREAGADPYALARAARVPREALTDPDMRVGSASMSRLIEMAATRPGLENIGLCIAEKRRLSTMGAMGLAIREQPTLRKALELFHQYAWLQNEALSIGLEEMEDVALLRIGMAARRGRQGSELTTGIVLRMIQAVVGHGWRPLEVRFTHAAPANLDAHRRLFGKIPQFDQDFVGMVLSGADLDRPIGSNDPEMAKMISGFIAHIAPGRGRPGLVDPVRQMILSLLPAAGCTVDRVAQRMAMDRRTLHRRLAAQDTSFTELLNATRVDLAVSLLTHSERPLQSVADMLGFATLSAFAHWFRRNFECTASAYRGTRSAPAGHAAALTDVSSGSRIT